MFRGVVQRSRATRLVMTMVTAAAIIATEEATALAATSQHVSFPVNYTVKSPYYSTLS
jgi:hypothetical protein